MPDYQWVGKPSLLRKLAQLHDPDAEPLMLEWRAADGPPLAPRRKLSRSIAHFQTFHGQADKSTGYDWFVLGRWDDVVSKKGVPFLAFHFNGPQHNPRLPVRDLAGVRPWGWRRLHA